MIHALDDPWIPAEAYTGFDWRGNPRLTPLTFEEMLYTINRQIDEFNLVVPILSKQRTRLRLNEEIERLNKGTLH